MVVYSTNVLTANVRIHHYNIERLHDGESYMIQDGRHFPGPVELIHHHSQYLDGFVTKPTIPCHRPNGMAPLAWPGFTMLELEYELLQETKKRGIKKVDCLSRTSSLFARFQISMWIQMNNIVSLWWVMRTPQYTSVKWLLHYRLF